MILMLDTVIKTKYRNLFVLIFLTVAIATVLIAYEFHEIGGRLVWRKSECWYR